MDVSGLDGLEPSPVRITAREMLDGQVDSKRGERLYVSSGFLVLSPGALQ